MTSSTGTTPSVSPWAFWLFSRYNSWYLRRHFRALRLLGGHIPSVPEAPPIFYLNHPGWWDPLTCIELINRHWPEHTHYTPMEKEQLDNFAFFRKIGVFGVDTDSATAGRRFLRTCEDVLDRTETALWMTPQGRFADARERPLDFQPGLGHLASRRSAGTLIPVGLTYSFWTDRYPEVLVGYGQPIPISKQADKFPSGWTTFLEQKLEQILDKVLDADQSRDASKFETVLGGSSGIGGVYGTWLWIRQNVIPWRSPESSNEQQQEYNS